MGATPHVRLNKKGGKLMSRRKVFERGRSVYVNLPVSVVHTAGIQTGDVVRVRYIEGIGIIVCKPVKIPLSQKERRPGNPVDVIKFGRVLTAIDGEFLEVIPVYDSPKFIK
jgi:hypothetical protein